MVTPPRLRPVRSGTAGTDDPSFAAVLQQRALSEPDGEVVRRAGEAPWTASELWAAATAVALATRDHLAPGAVVATATDTGPEAIAATAALSALGAVELPLAPDLPAARASRLLSTTRAVAVIATAARRTPALELVASNAGLPVITIEDLLAVPAGGETIHALDLGPSDPALIMTTSGTTGHAKAALLPVAAPIGQARRVAGAMGYGPDDVLLSMFAWHHINARNACFLPALISGARVVVAPRFSASGFLDLARAEGVTAFNFMGALCSMLLAQPATPRDHDHRIRAAYGGPAPAHVLAVFRERFGIVLRQAYACTELGDVAVTSIDELRPGAAGRVVADYDVRVVDEQLEPVPDGQPGELIVRPRRAGLAFLEYVDDPDATANAWHGDWFRTRDRGRLEDGWLWIDGRLGDVIRRRGVNIDPHPIEEALLAHPDVAGAAAVAVPSELTEDEVLAVVVPTTGAEPTPLALWEHCRLQLPRAMVPRFVSVEQSLPHNGNLKADRAALRVRGLPTSAWDADAPHPTSRET